MAFNCLNFLKAHPFSTFCFQPSTCTPYIKVNQNDVHPQYELQLEIDEFEIAAGLVLKRGSMRMWSLNPEYTNSSDGMGGLGGGGEEGGAEGGEEVQWAYEIYGSASFAVGGSGRVRPDIFS